MALSKEQYFEAGRADRVGRRPTARFETLYASTSWQGRAYTEGYAQGAIDAAKAAEAANPTTEEQPMAVLKEMETEGRAMLADSRDYHELEPGFVLVRFDHQVWLCRATESVALEDQEKLTLVATLTDEELHERHVDALINALEPSDQARMQSARSVGGVGLIKTPAGHYIYNPCMDVDGAAACSPVDHGFEEWMTGGNCTAWGLVLANEWQILITDQDGCSTPDLSNPDDTPLMGLYDADGEELGLVRDFATLPRNHRVGFCHRAGGDGPSRKRVEFRPDWSICLPWVSYRNGTAGRSFTTEVQALEWLKG